MPGDPDVQSTGWGGGERKGKLRRNKLDFLDVEKRIELVNRNAIKNTPYRRK